MRQECAFDQKTCYFCPLSEVRSLHQLLLLWWLWCKYPSLREWGETFRLHEVTVSHLILLEMETKIVMANNSTC